MVSVIWLLLIIVSLLYGMCTNVIEINNVILNISYDCLDVFFKIGSSLVLWGGILEVAKNTGFLTICTKKINVLTKMIFKTEDDITLSLISANIVCNVLGLSGLATPFSLEALSKLKNEKQDKDINRLLVFNYVGLSIFPMQVLALRSNLGSMFVMQLIPYIFILGLINTVVGFLIVGVNKCFT